MKMVEQLIHILTEIRGVILNLQKEKDKSKLEMIVFIMTFILLVANHFSEYEKR